ncbi:hypothetical protein T07_3028 [Trichinella nelsoni]|uniref:Uncharacterized protein n=1 Tax=Trichinella nelsoni TaxID=6336 RepID=A0A0V0RGF6_9BILA|nr:hypothetical protein T07_3028 [Trichinella nelsoni]
MNRNAHGEARTKLEEATTRLRMHRLYRIVRWSNESAQEAAGALEKELLQEFPSREAVDEYRGELVHLLCQGDKLKTLRHGTRSSVEWEQCANLMREQVGAADGRLRQLSNF